MNVNVTGAINVSIPDEYQKLNTMPEDPQGSVAFGKTTGSADCFMLMSPIDSSKAMPFDDKQAVIDGIHNTLAEDQGLIEVESGMTKQNSKFIYSIVKTGLKPSGMQYTLVMHISFGSEVLNVTSYFSEIGMTGQRDAAIINKLINEGVIAPSDMSKWRQDPYDANYSKGLLKNLSEDKQYDSIFASHPLSEARKLADSIINN